MVKDPPVNAGDTGSVWFGKAPEEGRGQPSLMFLPG